MTSALAHHEQHHLAARAESYRHHDVQFAQWAAGFGVIRHRDDTQVRVFDMAVELEQRGLVASRAAVYEMLSGLDRISAMGLWLVVHMTYAQRVYRDGRALNPEDFKPDPQGHTGGALNMVPAYAGYLAINALTDITRGWVMGQGHCVAAIDALNLLLGNLSPAHAERYALDDAGLSRFVQDFYSYAITSEGRPASPLGSHVNVHTAGGISEGGYLGFAELQYVHMPLPGERLVAFLSDGAFEEQRGSDWAPRWWRAEDSGMVAPIMIANGRRIEQRSTLEQQGGADWLQKHLRLNGFDPLLIDGTDPAAFAWAIWEMEERLSACTRAVLEGHAQYPVPLHYAIAEAPKGYGFPGAGTNRAHNLPLEGNPVRDEVARGQFNDAVRSLFVPADELTLSLSRLNNHAERRRVRERDHAMTRQTVPAINRVVPAWRPTGDRESPMAALDTLFCEIAECNPEHRVRVGNPDELASNRMSATLARCRHRVFVTEAGLQEAVDGQVITALNEEAIAGAALGNKGGLNLIVSYEAFAMKMLGTLRQELLFARHQKEAGRPAQWLGVPLLLSSHTWENGKNEQSHQDPSFAESLLGEMSDVAVVRFPADANSAMACLVDAYQRRGELHALVVPKSELPVVLSAEQSERLVTDGVLCIAGSAGAPVQLIAVGAFQLQECLKAWRRLNVRGVDASVCYLLEPGRFRQGRDTLESTYLSLATQTLFANPEAVRVVVSHTRPEPMLGVLRPLDTGRKTRGLGYCNRGGTLNLAGMLFANRCTWLHILSAVAELVATMPGEWLNPSELTAMAGAGDVLSIVTSGPCEI
ncbi:phosphoketolase family protein [Metapseudomonas boanensis]|uniref:Xylulose 5-phosphate 3-epimerase n=1 Tax=Metapseudomonas boanensis TaxID=2822138 RepID=A0ABS5XAV1_9GAMM|nr:xylulose 5-phosphate 3-epimerase [Pseudomonas boanensis]MBT8764817.1 xylulose 5-phosphate 3-epimerase [Pseudomonas boanensis]